MISSILFSDCLIKALINSDIVTELDKIKMKIRMKIKLKIRMKIKIKIKMKIKIKIKMKIRMKVRMKIKMRENINEFSRINEEWKNFLNEKRKVDDYIKALRKTIVFSIFFERFKSLLRRSSNYTSFYSNSKSKS